MDDAAMDDAAMDDASITIAAKKARRFNSLHIQFAAQENAAKDARQKGPAINSPW
jgi:hypothetical protein